MISQNKIQLAVFWQLLKRTIFVYFKNNAKDECINRIYILVVNVLVYQFLLPKMGLSFSGTFMVASLVVQNIFFGIMDSTIGIIGDLYSNRAISYDLTLPIKPTYIFIKIALANAFITWSQAMIIIPSGLIIFYKWVSFPHFQLMPFLLITLLGSLFSGFFSLWILSITGGLHELEQVWVSILYPISSFGCSIFTWKAMHSASPFFSYINMINPVMYMMEGVRKATLAPEFSTFSFATCAAALAVATIIIGYIGITRLKKQLDCI